VQAEAATPAPERAPEPVSSPPSAVAVAEESRPVRRLPRQGRIVYTLSMANNFNVGRTVQSWEIGDTSYQLSSSSETTGLAALFRSYQLDYQSTGQVTADGLRPEMFSARRGPAGEQRNVARLDWTEGVIAFEDAPLARVSKLPPQAQDLLSFVFQLGLKPLVPGQEHVLITNGAKLESYTLDIGPAETLQLPFGTVEAVPVRKVRERGEEGIEIWLATQYRYMPVRVRFIDREGNVAGEQLATEIRVSDD
jgi:hypothetical protein